MGRGCGGRIVASLPIQEFGEESIVLIRDHNTTRMQVCLNHVTNPTPWVWPSMVGWPPLLYPSSWPPKKWASPLALTELPRHRHFADSPPPCSRRVGCRQFPDGGWSDGPWGQDVGPVAGAGGDQPPAVRRPRGRQVPAPVLRPGHGVRFWTPPGCQKGSSGPQALPFPARPNRQNGGIEVFSFSRRGFFP